MNLEKKMLRSNTKKNSSNTKIKFKVVKLKFVDFIDFFSNY